MPTLGFPFVYLACLILFLFFFQHAVLLGMDYTRGWIGCGAQQKTTANVSDENKHICECLFPHLDFSFFICFLKEHFINNYIHIMYVCTNFHIHTADMQPLGHDMHW